MLKITFKEPEKGSYFNSHKSTFSACLYEEWLGCEEVKDMIEDIDNSKVISDTIIMSPFLGAISPVQMSGGVLGLILMLKCEYTEDKFFMSSRFGDNCFKWIFKIAEERDILIYVNSYFKIPNDVKVSKVYFIDYDEEVSDIMRINLSLLGGELI